jgi:hypothetical protein
MLGKVEEKSGWNLPSLHEAGEKTGKGNLFNRSGKDFFFLSNPLSLNYATDTRSQLPSEWITRKE